MKKLKTIPPDDLICMNDHTHIYGYRIDLAYAQPHNLLFNEQIYRTKAKLYLHKSLSQIVCEAAKICKEIHKANFILYDGLRTIEAQQKMMQTRRVVNNPQWLEEPRLLSSPGNGGHPRGMAIDIGLEDLSGNLLDMGTAFDYLANSPKAEHNQAHRDYPHLTPTIKNNRYKLDSSMLAAAKKLRLPLLLLPEEWWDFRLPSKTYNQYAAISDYNLPPAMRLI